MSATEPAPPPPGPPVAEVCPHCGAPLRPDQEWCLNCGAAVTTQVAGTPAWRTPIAIVGAVLLVAAVALVIAFVQLSDDSQRVAQAPTPSPAAAAPPGAATPAPTPTPTATLPAVPGASATPTPGATTTPDAATTPTPSPSSSTSSSFADWPAGETAYTVVMWSARTLGEAESKATSFQSAGNTVGILNSDDYSSLNPGYFVVFSGQYDTADAASSAAESAQSTSPDAYPRQVKPK